MSQSATHTASCGRTRPVGCFSSSSLGSTTATAGCVVVVVGGVVLVVVVVTLLVVVSPMTSWRPRCYAFVFVQWFCCHHSSAHQGVANRDLKLENLLLDHDGSNGHKPLLKICDFGFSKVRNGFDTQQY